MDTLSSLIIIAVAGLIHASFQLSVSMLTLLSSHTIGRKHSQMRLVLLSNSFTLGVGVMTLLLLSTTTLFAQPLLASVPTELIWIICVGMVAGLGVAVWLFYYRREVGTKLWIPRSVAKYFEERTKATKHSAEAFSLGLSSVLGELLFIFVPVTVTALVLLQIPLVWQLIGIGVYTLTSLSTLLAINLLIGSGMSISRIQRWREQNKGFLQFAAGSGLLALGFYVYVEQVISPAIVAAGGGL
ncbi:MAG: hypothetical protein ACSLEY_02665 [Candidatus Saccharimonadales bacterium]